MTFRISYFQGVLRQPGAATPLPPPHHSSRFPSPPIAEGLGDVGPRDRVVAGGEVGQSCWEVFVFGGLEGAEGRQGLHAEGRCPERLCTEVRL